MKKFQQKYDEQKREFIQKYGEEYDKRKCKKNLKKSS